MRKSYPIHNLFGKFTKPRKVDNAYLQYITYVVFIIHTYLNKSCGFCLGIKWNRKVIHIIKMFNKEVYKVGNKINSYLFSPELLTS